MCVTQPFYTVFMCHQQTISFWKLVVEEWVADPCLCFVCPAHGCAVHLMRSLPFSHLDSPVVLSSPILNQNQLFVPANNRMDRFLGLLHWTCVAATPTPQSQCALHQHYLLSGCWHGAEDEEAPSEQNISVHGMSQIDLRQACSPRRPIFVSYVTWTWRHLHLTEHQRQKLYDIGAWEKHLYLSVKHQHCKQHIGEKCLRSKMGKASFVNNCRFLCWEVTFLWGIHRPGG